MVRETRHLWVGNLPENIREDRIRDHFKRYGRVQSVKLLPRAKDDEGSGACATVSFMDIKSASKAHNNEQKLEDRTLTTEYHEPAAIPGSTATPIYSSQRFNHGPPEEISSFERSSHFYERERDRRDGDAYLRRASSTYHVAAAEPLRGRTRDRHYRNGPYTTPIIESVVSRQPPHHRSVGSSWSYDSSRYPPQSTTPDVYGDDRRDITPVVVVHKKHTKSRRCYRSGSGGSESGSNSSSVSRSRSSSSSSQSGSSSCSSASSSPASDKSSHHGSLRSGVTLQSAVSTPHTNNSSPAVHSDDRRPLAICVRNLPARSSDTSLKDGLFHEYKKHGKVTWVKVVGQGSDRYALVCFKKPDDVEKALLVSHDKLFFGCKIEVAAYQGYDVDDNEFRFVARPYEAEQDEFHPKATRTLFIGNLEKDITAAELRKHFDQFGEIIEIDIKKQGSTSSYAFCQYCDISSVVRAMRTLDGEHLGNNRIKLGFGKSLHTNCVWVDGVAESVTEKYLSLQFSQFGPVSHVAIDRSRGHALVFYDQIGFAQSAVKEMRGVAVRGRKLQVDFASRECQEAFYDHLEKQTGHNTTFETSVQVSPQATTGTAVRGFETPSSSSSSSGGGGGGGGVSARYPRYSTQPQAARSYSRGAPNTAVSPGTSPSTPARSTPRHVTTTPRFDFNADFMPDRRPYRSYEEMSLEDGGGTVTVTVGQGPQDIRHLQKERVALLEQLEDCASSGEEGSSRRRCKHRRSHSGEGSRPGTPLCDERPENLPPLEPRRTPRERPPDPLSLPLPRFATQLMSPRPTPRSPPASPPRPHSTSSDDSEPSPPSPEWEERLRSLDEKYEKWSGSRSILTKVDPTTLRVRHKLLDLDLNELQPSEIVKSVLAKRSVFDEDSKRLENFGEKYEPREFVPTRPGFSSLRPRIDSPQLHSPAAPKSPAAASSPAGAKGLQYPFPSHPPVQPTTSVATTTAPMSLGLCSSLSSVSIISSNVPSTESSKSQTFPTTCISTISSVRQFPPPPTTFHQPPKLSPPSPVEKKHENVDPRLCREDKMKAPSKLLSPNILSSETSDVMKEPTLPSPTLKPLKSCLRRESADDRIYDSGRRMSRDEEGRVLKTDCEKARDTESIERRRSYSDPRRRDSSDSSKDSLRTESVSDKLKDRNHKEERRRRDSVDNSVKKDNEIVEPLKSRLSDTRVSEHSDISDCTKSDSLNPNKNFDTRQNDNTRHTITDTSEKKKDSLQVCPERDRRRVRESLDISSDSSRNRKVPENLDDKKEVDCDTRQKDIVPDKNDTINRKSVDYNEKKRESSQQDTQKHSESFEKRKEKDITNAFQESLRHKEKKDQVKREKDCSDFSENTRHKSVRKSPDSDAMRQKDDRSKLSTYLENTRHKENSNRRESESSEDFSPKSGDIKKEIDTNNKYKDAKEQFSESYFPVGKPEESSENCKLKEVKKEPEVTSNTRHRENSKYFDFTRLREDEKKRDNGDSHIVEQLDLKREHTENAKSKYQDLDKESDIFRHIKQPNSEYPSHRFKDYDKRRDGDKHDFRTKNSEIPLQNDIFDLAKQKHYDKHNSADPTSQISEWVEEIRKDLENSGFVKNREVDNYDGISYEKRNSDASHSYEKAHRNEDKRKEEESKSKPMFKKEDDYDISHRDNDKKRINNSSDYKFYEKRKNADAAEIFRRKEIARKKDNFNDADGLKLKEMEKKFENDLFAIASIGKQRNIGDKKRDSCDQDRHRESLDHINDINHQREWYDEKHLDRKPDSNKGRRSNKEMETIDKGCESDPNDRKDYGEGFEKRDSSFEHHDDDLMKKNDFTKKEKKRENFWPAAIGAKRRVSSQDSIDINADDSKKSKPERRDSKDSGRSSSSSKKSTSEKYNKSFAKMLEEKIKEDKEKELNKKRKEDEIENMKILKKDKKISSEKRKEDRKNKQRHGKENGITASESEAGSGDDGSKTPKRHSIFDIVDEEPAYISMYDKVKARSTKNMQKQEEEKRQERLKEKFNQLKQSRAKREEKKRSTSYDEDSDSERGGRRSNKLMITSSEEDAGSEGDMRTKGRKIMSDTSEDDCHRNLNLPRIKPLKSNVEDMESKPRKIMSDTSEDDSRRLSIARIKVAHSRQEDLEPKMRKILSDTSEDDVMKHSTMRNKPSRIQSDESEVDLSHDEHKKEDGFVKKSNDYPTADLFSNISEDPEHPTQTDIEKEQTEQYHRNSIDSSTSDLPRKKSHKKKQKRQKNPQDSEEGNSKRHISKKDRRKSSHSHDADEDQVEKTKVRKKKSERDSSKRDDKMEDIFGPLSDDSDKTHNKWLVSQVYGSDSEDERQVMRKREKRRKERKARELDEAGRALEAKLLENTDSFPPSEDFKEKVKKKKRKKSREEKMSKHHQQRLEEAAAIANEADSEREPEPTIPPPSLPRLMESPPPPPTNQNKKPDIPGFGSQVDENIHETAVKSISESPTKPMEEKQEQIEEPIPSTNNEDKPTPVISQEETEDAVAALLLEDSFGGGFETYTKPDTPVSEPDLQIDTDTEDNYDPIDFSRPPRTPDIPTSFYRQQDTREGLEERILALACPDNSKQEGNQSPGSSPPTTHVNEYHRSDNENKSCNDKDKEDNNLSFRPKLTNSEPKISKPDGDATTTSKEDRYVSVSQPEDPKPKDLPPLIGKDESYNTSKTIYNDTSSQVSVEPKAGTKISKSEISTPTTSSAQILSKPVPKPLPPPLVRTTDHQLPKSSSTETPPSVIFTSPPSLHTETARNLHSIYPHAKVLTPTLQETSAEKSSLPQKPVSQIIVTPPTSVALIVQTPAKIPPTSQQNNSVLQLATKLHSPGGQHVDVKGNAQVSQYVLHHNVKSPQTLGSQVIANKPGSQAGSLNQGNFPQVQGNHKLNLPTMPVSKSPGLTVQAKPSPDHYKQMVMNQPHSQQLSVNVSHGQHVNANMLLSPSQQLNVNHSSAQHSPSPHHSPATLSFSPHHVKVSISQQPNNIHSTIMQLSPNVHSQASPLQHQQKHIQQHSPVLQHTSKNATLLQQVPNCIPVKLCSPTKPGTCHSIRHLTPVSQPNSINKMNAHVLQTSCVQQVRAVVLQNPTKQTVTLLQPQIVQKTMGAQMIRPLNAPQPQVVHTLKNDAPLEKNRPSPENIQTNPMSLKIETSSFTAKTIPKVNEEPLSLAIAKKEETHHLVKTDKPPTGETNTDLTRSSTETKIVKPTIDDVKPLNAVIQDLTSKVSSNQSHDSKTTSSATLDKVLQELHDRKKAVEAKDPVKKETEEIKPKSEEPSKVDSELEMKKEQEISNLKPENNGSSEGDLKLSEVAKIEPKVEQNVQESSKTETENPAKPEPEISSDKPVIKTPDEPKVEKIRIKKEENGLCIESSSSLTTKLENDKVESQDEVKAESKDEAVKNADDDTSEAIEAKEENKDIQGMTRATSEVASSRGRGGRRRKASGRGGGVVTRRARLNNNATSASETSADVYEFRDDSEEEANRPRLILTIKSPQDVPATPANPAVVNPPAAVPTAPAPAPAPAPPAAASVTTAQTNNTRKSRRLQVSNQEKDGVNRSTVDDTIEDVIRGTRSGGRRMTRASATCAASALTAQALETRKSPRRKQCSAPSLPALEPPATEEAKSVVTPATPAEPATPAKPPTPPSASQTQPPSTEPMTLIDPVTGLLIPMRESEEGQYIPVNSDHVRPPLESKEDSGEPAEKRMRTTMPTEMESSLPTRPGIPVKVPPNCAVVPPLPPKTTPKAIVSDLSRPIISHGKPQVTKTTGIVVPSGIPRPTSTLPSAVSLSKPLTIAAPSLVKPPQGVMMSPTGINNKASVTNVVGPMTINRVVAPPQLSPSAKVAPAPPLSHKTHLLQAVQRQKVPTPMTPKAHILHSINNVEGMVGAGTPPPPHHGPLLTGSVASPPLRAHSQQPVVTGASSARVVCKGGSLEPLKVESAGCIVVPSASPQSRSQVMQAGLPVPAYEASMGDVQHVNFPPHHIPPTAHYVHPQLVYQQYLREAALTGYLPTGVKGEIEDGPREALELRRGSPHDRATDSPQVATVYVHGPRHLYYEPPPAHRPAHATPRLQVATPPHASQVPPAADSLLMLLQRYPVMWQGLLALKTDQAAVQMHFVFGNPLVARDSLPCNSDGSTPPLRIAQRMRLEQTQVEGVARKMQMDAEHCMLLALPCGRDHMDVLQQSNNLQSGFITYLQQKQAAGIVNIAAPGSQQPAYVVHIFPSCDFANESLARIAPDLLHRVANIAHLLIVIATV